MLWTIILVLIAFWLLGVIASIGGALIHILLAVAVVMVLARLLRRNTAA